MEKLFAYDLRNHLSMAGMIIIKLRQEILDGTLKGGMVLKQDTLAQRYGVSISTLREAMKALEGEGLIEFTANKGANVKRMTLEEALEIFDVRQITECEALARSMPNLTEEDFFILEGLLDEEEFCTEPVLYSKINQQFHNKLYERCGNETLLKLIAKLHSHVSRYTTLYLDGMLHKDDSHAEHRNLLEACRKGDKRLAKTILRKHLLNAGQRLSEYLAQHPEL
ncbi:MAG: GntR family transcriptional regulator [Phascolarctobacterium sp.]|nr:GntR family transcriptional regulator [Phascolarctobacterium sp.]